MQSAEGLISVVDAAAEYVDLSDYCRLCLQLPEESQVLDLQLIYDEEEHLSYYDCFTICTQIDLRASDVGVPHQLCKSCGLELQVAYDFHKKVEESKKFLSQFGKIQQHHEEQALSMTAEKLDKCRVPDEGSEVVLEMEEKPRDLRLLIPLHLDGEIIENELTTDDDADDHLGATVEYEQLEDHIDMDEYQSVEELVDEDTDTVQPVATKMHEDPSVDYPLKICDESVKQQSDIEKPKSQPVLMKLAPPSDADDINLEEFLFENPDIVAKNADAASQEQSCTPTKPKPIQRRRGRTPVIAGGPPFQCEYCDHLTSTRTLLASHRHRKHRFNKPAHKCDECGKEFETKQNLQRHQRRVTCDSYPVFKCEFCDKVCTGRANYQVHLRFHKKVYPFVCHVCGKAFMMTQHLNTHVKTKHEGQRFFCEESGCGKMFQTAHALKNHAYTHVDQLPYRCDYCGREFPTKGRLRWHISRIHRIEHTLDELDGMLVAKEITLRAQLRPALAPDGIETYEEIDEGC